MINSIDSFVIERIIPTELRSLSKKKFCCERILRQFCLPSYDISLVSSTLTRFAAIDLYVKQAYLQVCGDAAAAY